MRRNVYVERAGGLCGVLMGATVAILGITPRGLAADAGVDPGNATWHIGIFEMFGSGAESVRRDYNLNIYAVFENGKFSHAMGSARNFNTSLHFVEKADIKLEGRKVSGKMAVVFTPDQWVPRNHQCVPCDIEFDGTLSPGQDKSGKPILGLGGTWKAVLHGSSQGPGPDLADVGKGGGKGASKGTAAREVKVGDQTWYLLTVPGGKAEEATVDGDTIKLGKQTLTFDGKKIVLGTFGGR